MRIKILALKQKNDSGFAILDVLIALMFLAIVLGAYIKSHVSTFQAVDKNSRYISALNIAQQSLESLLQVNPVTLDDSDDVSDSVTQSGAVFNRTIDVTVNANGSRTIDIVVSAANASKSATVNLTHTTSLWGQA